MKTTSPAMDGHLASSTTTLSICVKITAADGTILGFSNYTKPIPFEGVVYGNVSGQSPTAIASTATLSVDNVDVDLVRSIDELTGPDILRGKWDFADVRMFAINPNDIAAGPLKIRRGRVGQISLNRQKLTAEIRGMMNAFTKQILEIYNPGCRVDLFSSRCGVPLNPPIWVALTPAILNKAFDAKIGTIVKPVVENGRYFKCIVAGTTGGVEPTWDLTLGNTTVDASVSWITIEAFNVTGTIITTFGNKRVFESTIDKPDAFFTGGLIVWLTGLNAGTSMEIKEYLMLMGKVTLVLPMGFDLAVSDTFEIHAGCFKRLTEDCKTKFDNTHNFQGEPYVQQNFTISPARIDQNSGGK